MGTKIRLIPLALFFFFACSTQTPPAGQNPNSTPLVASGTLAIPQCAQLGTGTAPCSWTFLLDPKACSGKACKKLIVYFAGGQMTCPDPADASGYLASNVSHGYIAVCARLFDSSADTDAFPYHTEGSRADQLINSITSDANIQAAWSGEYLLISGVSHGATAPVIAMARTNLASAASWKGSLYTAACFFDGGYNVNTIMSSLKNNSCGPLNSVLSYKREYSRYCAWPSSAGLNANTWPTPASCSTADTAADSIDSVDPSAFTIRDWKLVECGSAMNVCQDDVFPAAPIQSLCNQIASDGLHTCSFTSFPNLSHIACGETTTDNACTSWFDDKLSAKGFH